MEKLLKELFGDHEGVLSESAQQSITTLVQNQVETLSDEKVKLYAESVDKEHTGYLQTIVESYEGKLKDLKETLTESIDEDHSGKVKALFEKYDSNAADKLSQVKSHYENLLNEGVKTQTEVIVEKVSAYFDDWLEEKVPTEFIEEAAKKDYATELLGKVSKLVGIHEGVGDDETRAAMLDAHNALKQQNVVIDGLKKDLFLQQETASLPVSEKKAIMESFSSEEHTFDFVKRNLEFQKKSLLKENLKAEEVSKVASRKTSSINVDRPQVIVESNQPKADKEVVIPPVMAGWINQLATSY